MTPEASLVELLARLGASRGAPILVSEDELRQWHAAAVTVMKTKGLLMKASPSASAVCPGCEQECVMPVHTLAADHGKPRPFIVCDKRSDINRVDVPGSRLEQWQASGGEIADLIADLLGARWSQLDGTSPGRWEIGILKGAKHSSHVVLSVDGWLKLNLAGHSIALDEVLVLEGDRLKLDKRALVRMVDKPISGAGDAESATQRRVRLRKRVQTERKKGNRSFLKVVAEEEGISVSRLKQILKKHPN